MYRLQIPISHLLATYAGNIGIDICFGDFGKFSGKVKMKSLAFLCLAVFLAVTLQKTEQAPPEKSCKMVAADFTKRQIQGISHCTKSLKFKNGKDKSKKMNCILRCVMIKENLLGEDGQTSPEVYNKFVESEFPPSMQDRFNGTFWNCMSMAFKGFKTLEEDEYCLTYDPFIKCLMGNVPGVSEICDE